VGVASGARDPALRQAILAYVRDADAGAPAAPAVQTSWLVHGGHRHVELAPVMVETGPG
jgi:hypothetical protein